MPDVLDGLRKEISEAALYHGYAIRYGRLSPKLWANGWSQTGARDARHPLPPRNTA